MADMLPPLTRWNAAGEPTGCVQIVHGMAEHRGRYRASGVCRQRRITRWLLGLLDDARD